MRFLVILTLTLALGCTQQSPPTYKPVRLAAERTVKEIFYANDYTIITFAETDQMIKIRGTILLKVGDTGEYCYSYGTNAYTFKGLLCE